MKKSQSTKLRLDVETIRTLSPAQLTVAAGGTSTSVNSDRCSGDCPTHNDCGTSKDNM
jgi:hypothetical protein